MKPTRRALLIMSPEKDIPGVLIDRENWLNHLHSPTGGAWRDNEILVSNSPTSAQLSSAQRLTGLMRPTTHLLPLADTARP